MYYWNTLPDVPLGTSETQKRYKTVWIFHTLLSNVNDH